jgi:beta-glucanase (GH16 family)
MKNFLFSIALLFIGTSLYSQEVLVWSDEFNIDGAIDSSKWFHQTQLPSGGNWYNNEEQHYTDRLENSYVSNGILNIVAKKEEYTEQGVTKQYTSARLNSKEVFKYGRMVIRAKLPSGTGTWPAIWMLGKNINEDGGYWDSSYGTTAWPACGEIDIMEHWGKNQNFVQSAMHTPSSYGGTINHGGQNISTASSDFHEYELDWNAERMIFSVDGVEHYTYNPSTKNACEWPYDAEQYFLLNIAIEQGGADITETAMEIDYIRVYQNAEGYASSNTTLIDLKLDGETINDFNCTSPSSYTVTLPNNASVPLTTATPTDTNANVSITAASSIPGNTIIEVMAEDGITTENYTIYFVTNTSNTWTGNTNNNWDTATNWSRNTIPTEGTDVFIPASISNYPTANSSVTVNSVAMASGSSLIAAEAFLGNITYTRNLETNNWYLISSPILGETYDNEFVSANGLASSGLNNAIAKYQTSDDSWNYMQNGESHSFNPGTGYSVRRTSGSGEISFTGTLNVNNTSIALTTSGNGYNLVGNPYPSYINSNSMLSSNTESLLTETLWVWNQTVYEPKNLASNFILSPGQGFFVQSDGDTGNLSITENNQIHQSNDTFQKGVSKSEIHLTITDGSSKRDTNIYYIEGTTTSFDNGYDSPIFNNGGNDFGIYTHLVSNSEGNDYGIQSLPHKDFEKIVVPLGINAISGSMITITGEKKNFPEAINVYIEDKEEETFILLDTSSHFTTTLSTDLNGIGRFYIHTASKTLNTNYFDLKNNVSINACSKNKLCINGIKNGAVKVRIYDILGKQVLMASFEGNSVNNISLPSNLNEGVYIVQLITEKETLVKKIRM